MGAGSITHMNRRTLDLAVPMLYVAAIMITIFAGGGAAVGVVSVIGALFVGFYFAALRRNVQP